MYVVHSGRVLLQRPSAAEPAGPGARRAVPAKEEVVAPGGMFGEEALMHREGVDYSAVASGMVQLWRLHRLAFKILQVRELSVLIAQTCTGPGASKHMPLQCH